MKGFPKTLKTRQDIEHCFEMAQSGELAVSEIECALKCIEEKGFLKCPVVTLSANRKTVTIRYCNEAKAGEAGNAVITNVKHETDPNDSSGGDSFSFTVLTLQSALSTDETVIRIPVADPYEAMGITRARINEIKEALGI
jgi:hypothetical protein